MLLAKLIPWAVGTLSLLLVTAAHGQTVTRSLSINPYGTFIEGNAEFDKGYNSTVGAQGLILGNPNTLGSGSLQFAFTVPEDYAPGTQMALRVLWRSDATLCVINLTNNTLYRSPGNGGLTDQGGLSRQSQMFASNNLLQTEVTLFNLNGLGAIQAGDAISAGLFRSATDDSCSGDLHILGLSIVYEAQTNELFLDRFEASP
jgi:hypothetical protein